LKREPVDTLTLTTISAVTAFWSCLVPRDDFGRVSLVSSAPGGVACSMPDGRNGGRAGNPFSCVTSSRDAWFLSRNALIVACCALAPHRRAPISATKAPTKSRNSETENRPSNAASGSDIQAVNHAVVLSATMPSGDLPRLRWFCLMAYFRYCSYSSGHFRMLAPEVTGAHLLSFCHTFTSCLLHPTSLIRMHSAF